MRSKLAQASRFLKDEAKGFARDPIGKTVDRAVAAPAAWTLKNSVRDTTPSMGNLWTGKKESALGVGAAWGIAGGYTAYNVIKENQINPRVGTVSYTGTAPAMDYDGVGSTTNAPTLNASGSMVFGLHNSRKG